MEILQNLLCLNTIEMRAPVQKKIVSNKEMISGLKHTWKAKEKHSCLEKR